MQAPQINLRPIYTLFQARCVGFAKALRHQGRQRWHVLSIPGVDVHPLFQEPTMFLIVWIVTCPTWNRGRSWSQADYSVWKIPSQSHHESFLKPGDGLAPSWLGALLRRFRDLGCPYFRVSMCACLSPYIIRILLYGV